MHVGKLVFAQLTGHLPLTTFRRCVAAYGGEHKLKSFSCLDQFLCLAFAQLTYRESLRDIEACLRAQSPRGQSDKLYHMGIRSRVSRSTLADANEARDWRIYADFAQRLIGIAIHRFGTLHRPRVPSRQQAELRSVGKATGNIRRCFADVQIQPIAVQFPAVFSGEVRADQFGDTRFAGAKDR